MTKELTPLEALQEIKEQIKIFYAMLDDRASNKNNLEPTLNKLSIIEKSLKELDFYRKRDAQFKQDVNNLVDKLKALEIIKNKEVNVRLIYETETVDDYNYCVGKYINLDLSLTQEEYDLLKEVL